MIQNNVITVRQKIAEACYRSNRDPSDVTLVAVSKTNPIQAILEAADAGVQHFGENRVEEASTKVMQLQSLSEISLKWHMIGHIQSRKVGAVASLFDVIHSIDSLKLASKFSSLVTESKRAQPLKVLIQVNVSGEETKGGLEAENWLEDDETHKALWNEFEQILVLPGIEVCGLMMMAPYWDNQEALRPFFRSLVKLRAALSESFGVSLQELSMGMTNDYEIAIEEGSTMVRVGRAIFGER